MLMSLPCPVCVAIALSAQWIVARLFATAVFLSGVQVNESGGMTTRRGDSLIVVATKSQTGAVCVRETDGGDSPVHLAVFAPLLSD